MLIKKIAPGNDLNIYFDLQYVDFHVVQFVESKVLCRAALMLWFEKEQFQLISIQFNSIQIKVSIFYQT